MKYSEFLQSKKFKAESVGIDVTKTMLNPKLFDFQKDIVHWTLKKGKSALFEDCGLGKSSQQLEWAHHVPGNILILVPLSVAHQTVAESKKFNIPGVKYCRYQSEIDTKITIANYEMLDHFDSNSFSGIVLDESSILKSFDSKTKKKIIDVFSNTQYKLACTATPAPNDFMELGNHAEFLNVMTRAEMLATFFVHDGGDTAKWRLKRHAEKDFWEWVSSWAVVLSSPKDLGYSNDGYELPPLEYIEHIVETDIRLDGNLFVKEVSGMGERIKARGETVEPRVKKCAEIVQSDVSAQWLIWCGRNGEGDLLEELIPGAVQIAGTNSIEFKEKSMDDFINGKIRILISKPKISGFGLNLQNCHNIIFCGLNDSYEQLYQAVRRCWRFGQVNPVNAHIVVSDIEGSVLNNIKRKDKDFKKIQMEMVDHMKHLTSKQLHYKKERPMVYDEKTETGNNYTMYLGDCVEVIKKIQSDKIHYTLFSPPFASLYTYSASHRDMGNTKNNEEFIDHFKFLIPELLRVTMPGRLLSFHCMNLPISKEREGYIGIRDFRGELIREFIAAGWIYHSEVVIWKDPVTAMQRTKALGLLHKQIKKDSCMSRQGIPDYLVTMRKPGDNPERVTHTNESFPVSVWQRYASPVWMDINPSDTLQRESAREHEDERHICPLQLQVIERAIDLWTNPADIILSPFAGIGSEGYQALKQYRKFIGIELKESYYRQAVANLRNAELSAKSQQVMNFE